MTLFAAARTSGPGIIAGLLALLANACGGQPSAPPPSAAATLDRALAPAAYARALGTARGGHFTATASFRVAREGATGVAADRAVVKTTTDLVLAPNGDFRLVEENDRDGGREVILSGKELAVGLRPGKLIKRPAQAAESERFLEEALGGPHAVWELARRTAKIVATPAQGGTRYDLSLAPEPLALPEATAPRGPLAAWRKDAKVQALTGQIELDTPTQLLRRARLEVRFSVMHAGATTLGTATVEAQLTNVGAAGPVAPPVADAVRSRQRTILEERALLGQRPPSAGATSPARPR
jgi:hypothetical protein